MDIFADKVLLPKNLAQRKKQIAVKNEKFINVLLKTLWGILLLCVLYVGGRVLVIDRFHVGGKSMEPTLQAGDPLWVEKWTMGARIYRKFDFSMSELSCFRLPGSGWLKPGDIAVFNSTENGKDGNIGFRINHVYAKRCIGTPGDTVRIVNGFYHNSSAPGRLLCPPEGQVRLSEMAESEIDANGLYWRGLPGTPWTIKNFGPLFIPSKGSTVFLDTVAAAAYAKAVEYETGSWPLPGETYTFKSDWYFFGGDNVLDSRDSRYIGLVPADYVVGRVIALGHKGGSARRLRKRNKELESALTYAGTNRGELENVLVHYADNARKCAAAEWLITNMPGHYGCVPSAEQDSVKAILRDIRNGMRVAHDRIEKWKNFNPRTLPRKYDSKVITHDYLIRNIDQAFDAYDSRPWNRYITEEDFRELILPYRVGDEPIGADWRRMYRDRFGFVLDSSSAGSDVIKAVDAIQAQLKINYFQYNTLYQTPSPGPEFLMDTRIGSCKESCEFTLYLLRALGIPVAIDHNAMAAIHSWNVVLDTTGRYEVFWIDRFTGTNVSRGGNDGRRKGKVWRRTYAYPCRKDVSASYFEKNRILCRSGWRGRPWMGLFTAAHWHSVEPVHKIGPYAVFRDVEPGMAFIPMTEGKESGYPVVRKKDGQVLSLVPDHKRTGTVTIKRKTRLTDRVRTMMAESEGIRFVASTAPDFRVSELIGTCGLPKINYNYIEFKKEKTFRYLKLIPMEDRALQLGEIRLFRDGERTDTIDVEKILPVLADSESRKLVDNDELTYYRSSRNGESVMLDLGRTEKVRAIEWVPRNDDNFIRHGDEYKLMFQDGKRGWSGLGSQIATDSLLVFQQVPARALLRLHDVTRGKEEGVFVIKDGRQLFL